MRVCIAPFYKGEDQGDGGIRRVVEAQMKYFPDLGWDVTDNPDEADLIACHGATLVERPGIPMVAHCHGLLWEDYFLHHGDDVNKHVIEVMVRAQAVTAPSRWVAHAISRGMLVRPTVIYHGVDADTWAPTEPALDYVLWNKARIDPVSDPADMQHVAALLPDLRFLTTYGHPTQNVLPIGVGTYEQMRPVAQRAAVYLATARETFGIGTLEALAAGVPVAGWDYGGQQEIIIQGETGYLVPFGDHEALANAIRRCIAERDRLSANAVADSLSRWLWQDKIKQYADLYNEVIASWRMERPSVSVVIPAYNMERYLGEALTSVAEQTLQDWECLIIDDCSTDDTPKLAALWTEDQHNNAQAFTAEADNRFSYIRTPYNLGLSGARNFGWKQSRGRYILFLDADDMLAPNALDLLSTALDRDSSIHIASGALDTVSADGTNRKRNPWPAGQFNWHAQIAHLNQLHGASLMRREVLEHSGGYRTRDWRAEDASFWARVTSFGFRAARVTDDTIQIYRMHDDQKSRSEPGDGDWTAWFPWRLAGGAQEGLEAVRQGAHPNSRITPFGAQGAPPAPMKAWPVRHFQHPLVSVVIPVGPGHEAALIDALDSVQAQTLPEWECIVVDDTVGKPMDLTPWPWIKHVPSFRGPITGPAGAGAARNVGLAWVRSPFVVFLDADDILHPRFLEETLKAYDGRYVYTDWATLNDPVRIDGEIEPRTVEDYDQRAMLEGLRHAVTTLLPTEWARLVGGFDEGLPVFEDWDFYNKLAVSGYCGKRLARPLLIYRHQYGGRTRAALKPRQAGQDAPAYTELGEQAADAISDRYTAWHTGEEPIMGCCSGNNHAVVSTALNDMVSIATGGVAQRTNGAIPPQPSATIRMEFIGNQQGAQTFYGKGSGLPYIAGRDPRSRFHDVDPRDVEHFTNGGMFRVVEGVDNTVEDGTPVPIEPRLIPDRPRPKGRRARDDGQ